MKSIFDLQSDFLCRKILIDQSFDCREERGAQGKLKEAEWLQMYPKLNLVP